MLVVLTTRRRGIPDRRWGIVRVRRRAEHYVALSLANSTKDLHDSSHACGRLRLLENRTRSTYGGRVDLHSALMGAPTLKNDTVKVGQLVAEYRAGRIVIPEFQRDYVWRKNRAPKLIDSLYRSFPISTLLLWR
jgi:hypothetical protein